jgi:hypothetical protein
MYRVHFIPLPGKALRAIQNMFHSSLIPHHPSLFARGKADPG